MDLISFTQTVTVSPAIYGLLVVGGFFITTFVAYAEWRSKSLPKFKFWLMIMWVGVFSIYGAKWWHLVFHPESWNGFVSSILDPGGDRSILGSIVFGSVTVWIFTKTWMPELEWRRTISILLPNIFLGQAIGRWGNFANQEVYGQIVDNLDWLPSWIADHMWIASDFNDSGIAQEIGYRQPLFLFESIANLFAWTLITFGMKNNKIFKPGTHASAYLVSYGVIRASMELLRDEAFIMKWGTFPTSFFLSIIIAVVGLGMFIYYQFIFGDDIATYWRFKHAFKVEQWKANIKETPKFFNDRVTFKQNIESNKLSYNKNINDINTEDVAFYLKQVREDY